MAKIAVSHFSDGLLERALAERAVNGAAGQTAARTLSQGDGWTVEDVVCTSGPHDRPFEEEHTTVSIAIVAAGSFQYRSTAGRALMTPGSLMLGNAGHRFECGHDHGAGDRCIAFRYAPDYFDRLSADVRPRGHAPAFGALRLPPVRALSGLVARACAGLIGSVDAPWEELSVHLASQVVQVVSGGAGSPNSAPPGAEARVTRIVRTIERHPDAGLTIAGLAREARLSPFHFLRTFERVTGLTPHQYVRRARLREAAVRLALEPANVLDIAFDCGFGDISTFNRAFRTEFGVSPRVYRATESR